MSIKKNFLYNTIYQLFNIFIPLLTVPYISRVLGPYGIGQYTYTFTYSQYFVFIGMIGIGIYGSRQIASIKENKRNLSEGFWSIYTLQLITSRVSLLIYI